MRILFKIFYVAVILTSWAYITTIVTEYLLNRPLDSTLQLMTALSIMAYSFFVGYTVYRILSKSSNQ
jgi:succinate dehydrogenase hydrophobic anchor subunit